ncbi:TatD family hydrolase [Streptomyces albus]|nr:TatD family hydrolase [Streptomyces albus]
MSREGRKGQEHEAPPLPEALTVEVADSHTHVDMQADSMEETLAKAASVGVTTLIQVGCDLAGSRWAAEAAAAHDQVHAAVALHPNEAPASSSATPTAGPARANAPQAAKPPSTRPWTRSRHWPPSPRPRRGETGLDHFRTGPDGMAAQERSFRAHIELAKRHDKALVIHDREAHADVLRVLREEGAPDRTVFHCFSGDADMARTCADHGYYMSFVSNITFKNAHPLREALKAAPQELLLVETDAPFLTPAPYRGRPNAPYLIPVTVRAMAEIREEPVEKLAGALAANTAEAFGYRR